MYYYFYVDNVDDDNKERVISNCKKSFMLLNCVVAQYYEQSAFLL